jgi:hypothetical protein
MTKVLKIALLGTSLTLATFSTASAQFVIPYIPQIEPQGQALSPYASRPTPQGRIQLQFNPSAIYDGSTSGSTVDGLPPVLVW